MPRLRAVRLCLLLAFTALGTACVTTAPAGASVGELTRFGEAGPGHGQFTETGAAVAFGVDPTENTTYVGDEPEPGKFRIQKFGSKGEFLAETRFEFKNSEEAGNGVQGIAVDPKTAENPEGRIYVLSVVPRSEVAEFDPAVSAAGSVYAFKTAQNGQALEAAVGTKESEGKKQGLLGTLRPQAKNLGEPLLEPSGIAVDPKTHDIVVMGKEDLGEAVEPSLRVAFERVTSKGTVRPARYVDKSTLPFFASDEATSPAVSSAGKVYVVGGALEVAGSGEITEQIDEIPANFESGEAPKPVVKFTSPPPNIVSFPPGSPAPTEGGALSIAPDGTFYAYASIKREELGGTFSPSFGALAFDPTGAEIGWTGGQVWTKKSGTVPCAISFEGHPVVGAGSEGRVFVFDANPSAPSVVEFGPGGSGCPTATASAPIAKENGQAVEGVVAPNAEVVLTSKLKQANALSVEWNFGDGTPPQTVSRDEFETTEITHKFTKEETVNVSETIHTDNMATPEIKTSVKLSVEVPKPIGAFNVNPGAGVTPGAPVKFDAKGSSDPRSSPLKSYAWEFGDRTPVETRPTPTIEHTFTQAGAYVVTLRVTDELGLTSRPVAHTVIVTSPGGPPPPAIPPPVASPPPSAPVGGGAVVTPPAPTTGGVLPYVASLAKTSLAVSKIGVLQLVVNCAGRSSCAGTVTLRTLSAVSAGKRKAILTLAAAPFSLAGGQVKAVTLRLSARARGLLARAHVLRARATILARDSQGSMHTTQILVTLRAAKPKHR